MRCMKLLLLFFAAAVLFAASTDISGKWKGSADTPMGTIERTFVFKVDGNKLTGETTSEMTGKSAIENGSINGDAVAFTITASIQGTEAKISYTGKVKGDTIQLKADVPAYNQSVEYTIHRIQ